MKQSLSLVGKQAVEESIPKRKSMSEILSVVVDDESTEGYNEPMINSAVLDKMPEMDEKVRVNWDPTNIQSLNR